MDDNAPEGKRRGNMTLYYCHHRTSVKDGYVLAKNVKNTRLTSRFTHVWVKNTRAERTSKIREGLSRDPSRMVSNRCEATPRRGPNHIYAQQRSAK